MNDYQYLRDKLIALRSSRETVIASNKKHAEITKKTVDMLKSRDFSFVELLGIDMSPIISMDFDRITCDEEYFNKIYAKNEELMELLLKRVEEAGLL